jgi:hypothetical protein
MIPSPNPCARVPEEVRYERPKIAERSYCPHSTEEELLTACRAMFGRGPAIPLRYWDDWILQETDLLIQMMGAEAAGKKIAERADMPYMRAIRRNILDEEKKNGS